MNFQFSSALKYENQCAVKTKHDIKRTYQHRYQEALFVCRQMSHLELVYAGHTRYAAELNNTLEIQLQHQHQFHTQPKHGLKL